MLLLYHNSQIPFIGHRDLDVDPEELLIRIWIRFLKIYGFATQECVNVMFKCLFNFSLLQET